MDIYGTMLKVLRKNNVDVSVCTYIDICKETKKDVCADVAFIMPTDESVDKEWFIKGEAEFLFEKIVKECKCKYIVFVYTDSGILSKRFIESALKRFGEEDSYVYKKDAEQTFYFIKKKDKPLYIAPLNYSGNKFDSLDLLVPNIPKGVDTFYDLFGGGCSVGINADAKKIVYNDINYYVVNLLKFLATTNPVDVYKQIMFYIDKYHLCKRGKEGYSLLRADYNKKQSDILLYMLVCYGFSNQIRFNSKKEFNTSCGKNDFNDYLYEKMISFYLRCQDIDIEFRSDTYKNYTNISNNDFVYLDPPYLGTVGVYQDGKRGFNGWDVEQEKELYEYLEDLDKNDCRFMLSNYKEYEKGKDNPLLRAWIDKNKYTVVERGNLTNNGSLVRREIIVMNKGEK